MVQILPIFYSAHGKVEVVATFAGTVFEYLAVELLAVGRFIYKARRTYRRLPNHLTNHNNPFCKSLQVTLQRARERR
jgi:hypothetical protein